MKTLMMLIVGVLIGAAGYWWLDLRHATDPVAASPAAAAAATIPRRCAARRTTTGARGRRSSHRLDRAHTPWTPYGVRRRPAASGRRPAHDRRTPLPVCRARVPDGPDWDGVLSRLRGMTTSHARGHGARTSPRRARRCTRSCNSLTTTSSTTSTASTGPRRLRRLPCPQARCRVAGIERACSTLLHS